MLATARALYKGSDAPPQPNFNPNFRYLRAIVNGSTSFLVLGYLDPRPEGTVEVWYSGGGEVIRLLNGHLIGSTGLTTDWRAVRFSDNQPSWSAAQAGGTQIYERERDMMPGYHFGIRDRIERSEVPAPKDSHIAGTDPASLRWFEERSTTRPATASLPPARFAVSKAADNTVQVVYSEQCISRDLCMRFEQWTPPAPPTAGTSASAGK